MKLTLQWEVINGKISETTAVSVEEPTDGVLVAEQLRDIAIDLWREAAPTTREDSAGE